MSYLCSLSPLDPLRRSYSTSPYSRSGTSLSVASDDTVKRNVQRYASGSSLLTVSSLPGRGAPAQDENSVPGKLSSPPQGLASGPNPSLHRRAKSQASCEASCGLDTCPLTPGSSGNISLRGQVVRRVSPLLPAKALQECSHNDLSVIEATFDRLSASPPRIREQDEVGVSEERATSPDLPELRPEPILKRWMSTLRRRNQKQTQSSKTSAEPYILGEQPHIPWLQSPSSKQPSPHRRSSSGSSLAFVTAIRSATITLASTGIASSMLRSRTGQLRSSEASDPRASVDSTIAFKPPVDEATWLRSVRRHKILEELISTEESYVNDMKTFVDVYFTMLASPTSQSDVAPQIRKSVHGVVSHILQLHVELLSELHRVIPNKSPAHVDPQPDAPAARFKHTRWHSVDDTSGCTAGASFTHRLRHSIDLIRPCYQQPLSVMADTKVVAALATVFLTFASRFFIYEAYAAHQHILEEDAKLNSKSVVNWHIYERGIEALSNRTMSINQQAETGRKSLTLNDLIIKPYQRITKYPLLFMDLCKHTPVCDDPEAHQRLEKTISQLQRLNNEVNSATGNPYKRSLVEKSWLLQDRLIFNENLCRRSENCSGPLSFLNAKAFPGVFEFLGHVILCGVLHVAYQANERVKGTYLICILYRSYVLFASTSKPFTSPETQQSICRPFTSYDVVAAVCLANASIEEADNGRGLQCHTAPYTWKLLFQSEHRAYEMVMSACSSQEAQVWREHLLSRITIETQDLNDGRTNVQEQFSFSTLDIRPLSTVFNKPAALLRRASVRRAATLGPKSNLTQVIIKNTQATSNSNACKVPAPVTRSQSHLSASHIPILAPRRSDRCKLESAAEDVWTAPILPYPGMLNRRTENPIRAGANHVMRKLSMASIASNFSKRSASFTSLSQSSRTEEHAPSSRRPRTPTMKGRCAVMKQRRADVVSFQATPAAFLPPDFTVDISTGRLTQVLCDLEDKVISQGIPRPASAIAALDGCDERVAERQTTPKMSGKMLRKAISSPKLLNEDISLRQAIKSKLRSVFKAGNT